MLVLTIMFLWYYSIHFGYWGASWQHAWLCIKYVVLGVFLAGMRCSYVIHLACQPSVACREKMALITGCNAGKHPAAPFLTRQLVRTVGAATALFTIVTDFIARAS